MSESINKGRMLELWGRVSSRSEMDPVRELVPLVIERAAMIPGRTTAARLRLTHEQTLRLLEQDDPVAAFEAAYRRPWDTGFDVLVGRRAVESAQVPDWYCLSLLVHEAFHLARADTIRCLAQARRHFGRNIVGEVGRRFTHRTAWRWEDGRAHLTPTGFWWLGNWRADAEICESVAPVFKPWTKGGASVNKPRDSVLFVGGLGTLDRLYEECDDVVAIAQQVERIKTACRGGAV